jgi:hypothetical protein
MEIRNSIYRLLHSRCVLFVYMESRAECDGGFDFCPTVMFQAFLFQ